MSELVEATRDAYGRALVKLGEERDDVVVLDADLSGSTRTKKFAEKYPDRFFNAGVAEQNLINMAAGLALAGKVPFASTFAIFATGRAWEQIRNTVAYPRLPVRIVATHAGLTVGEDGASHQALEDIALMRAIPGMKVIVPADGKEAEAAVRATVDLDGPVYVRLGRAKVPTVTDGNFELGRGTTLSNGDEVAIIASGIMVSAALEASRRLRDRGVGCRVVNMSTIKPLDEDLIVRAARDCGAVVTAEEHNILGGLGGAVAELLSERCPVPVIRVGVRDVFGQSGSPDELLQYYGLMPQDIEAACREAMELRD
ncbi:MAG: transketolase family protein [Bacillota bacterium]